MSDTESPTSEGRNDHCRRCGRTGFELFKVAYDTGYGPDGDNWMERWVCRDCRSQLSHLVNLALAGTDKVRAVVLPWYKVDQHGWPIVRITNRPIQSFFRLVVQNIRKVTG